MRLYVYLCVLLTSLLFSNAVLSTSIFHSYITELSPPYTCRLKLIQAKGILLDTKHSYQFGGICSIKIPVGNSWSYQSVWVDLIGNWNSQTHEATEVTTLANGQGMVLVQLKCDDDPWLTKAQCAMVGYQNTTQFTNLSGVANFRNGQYPPFQLLTGEYPPLARNQAIVQEALALSILSAKQEAANAHAAFNQAFAQSPVSPPPQPIKCITKIFKNPKVGNVRLDYCLQAHKDCGKPAADAFCRSMGYKCATRCKVDPNRCLPTFIMGTQTICTQPYCRGFEEIECAR